MLVLTFEEFPNVFDNKNEAKSNFDIERIGCDLTLIAIEVVMRSQITEIYLLLLILLLIYIQLMVLVRF